MLCEASRAVACLPHLNHNAAGIDNASISNSVILGSTPLQVRILLPGFETVLGDAASDAELFVTDDYVTLPLAGLPGAPPGSRGWVFRARQGGSLRT